MERLKQYHAAKDELISRYPEWQSFIEELLYRIKPIYLDEHDRDKVRFIHLINFGSRATALKMLNDVVRLLKWQDQSIFLLSPPGSDESEKLALAWEFQKTHRFFPEVLVTDYLNGLFTNLHLPRAQTCREFSLVESFLLGRKWLELTFQKHPASYAKGGLVINFLDSFANDKERILEMVQLIREKQFQDPQTLKKEYVPKNLSQALEMGFLLEDELLFFSEDKPALLQLSFDLAQLVEKQEQAIEQLTGMQTSFSEVAVQHFIQSLDGNTPNFEQLEELFQTFIMQLIEGLDESLMGKTISLYRMQLDYQGEWLFHFKIIKQRKDAVL